MGEDWHQRNRADKSQRTLDNIYKALGEVLSQMADTNITLQNLMNELANTDGRKQNTPLRQKHPKRKVRA